MCWMNVSLQFVVDMYVNPPIACHGHTMYIYMVNARILGVCFRHIRLMCPYLHKHLWFIPGIWWGSMLIILLDFFFVLFLCVFCLSTSCVICVQCWQFLWIVQLIALSVITNLYFLVFKIYDYNAARQRGCFGYKWLIHHKANPFLTYILTRSLWRTTFCKVSIWLKIQI
jgi:hypothetical protein